MNYTFVSISMANFMLCGIVALYVLANGPMAVLNRMYFLFALAVAFFCLFDAVTMLITLPARAALFNHLSVIFWLAFLALFSHFCIIFAGFRKNTAYRAGLALIYLSALIIAYFNGATDWFYKTPVMTAWGPVAQLGKYFYLFAAYSVTAVLVQIGILYFVLRRSTSKREKKQIQTILTGLMIASSIGVIFDVIIPHYFQRPPSSIPIATMIYTLVFGYAIIRHGLLNVTPGQIANDILLTIPDAVVFIDIKRNINIINQAFIDLLGYSKDEITDKCICKVFNAEAEAQALIDDLQKNGKLEVPKILLKKKDGSIVPMMMDGALTNDRYGEDTGYLMIFRDIGRLDALTAEQKANISELTKTKERMLSILEDTTEAREAEKKRAEELAVAIENMKGVDKMKTEFLSVISHELRTPLTPIIGYISMFIDQTFGPLDPKYIQKAEIIKKESEHLHGIIESLLDVSRLERGVMIQVNKEPVSFKAMFDELAIVMKPQFDARKTMLEINIPGNSPAIMGDPVKLNRLLTNLLGNTLKYVPQGGHVTVSEKIEGNNIRIEVADNGIGIAKENLEKIFDKFFQVDGSYTRSAGGVGLGLAIVKEIVTAHGGKIWAESEGVGKGAKFIFTLPIA